MTRTGSLLLADVDAPSCPPSECNLTTGSDAGASGWCTGSLVTETVTWQVSLISDVGSLVLSTSDHAGGNQTQHLTRHSTCVYAHHTPLSKKLILTLLSLY